MTKGKTVMPEELKNMKKIAQILFAEEKVKPSVRQNKNWSGTG